MRSFAYCIALLAAAAHAALPSGWEEGFVTYYGGQPSGGGACEYPGEVTDSFPNGNYAAVDFTLFGGGAQCGACFEVKCTGAFTQGGANNCQCNPNSLVIQVDNSCCDREYGLPHFDLNPAAMGAIIDNDIGTCGMASIQFRRVACAYNEAGKNVIIDTKSGVSAYWFGFMIRNVAGYGNALKAEIKSSGSSTWHECERSAAFRKCDGAYPLTGPVSIRLTDEDGKQIVGEDIITDLNAGEKEWDFGTNFAYSGSPSSPSAPAPVSPPSPPVSPVSPSSPPAVSPVTRSPPSGGTCGAWNPCTHDETCCKGGLTCKRLNAWYAQCRPAGY